jgi:hypothetical protein
MAVHLNPFYLVITAVAALLVYHLAYRFALILRDPSLVCWGVGPLGVTAVALRKPGVSLRAMQFFYAALAMGAAIYFSLFASPDMSVVDIPHTEQAILLAVAAPVALVTLVALLATVHSSRYALWGEAHVLSAVQRATALGVVLFFTPQGRAFLHDRFNATPSEFIQTIRS